MPRSFDLAGYLVRKAVLSGQQIAAIRDQVLRQRDDPGSLPVAEREMPGGAAAVLIDHPAVLGVLNEVIGPEVRLENIYAVCRDKGERHGGLHGGGDRQLDPIFGYRPPPSLFPLSAQPVAPRGGGGQAPRTGASTRAWSA